jgi:hypothetical protein
VSGGAPCGCGQAACGCCEGVRALTPLATENRPGLDALSARIGTHGSFLATMKARLSSHAFGEGPAAARPLAGLGVRDADASIALLDAFATIADVLTFYQERVVNEGYLRTATATRSVRELARLVGYAPRPGVAAGAWLAYTLDDNVPEQVTIAAGSRVRTVPGPGELPQMFETCEDLVARSAWNRLGVRQTEPSRWVPGAQPHALYLAGTTTRLKPGEPLLVARGDGLPEPYRILLVDEQAQAGRTRIEFEPWEGGGERNKKAPAAWFNAVRQVLAIRGRPATGTTAKAILDLIASWEEPDPDKWPEPAEFASLLEYLTQVRAAIGDKLKQVPNLARARNLKAWAAQLDGALAKLIDETELHLGRGCNVEALIEKLTVPPAVPPRDPLQLAGSLSDRFEESGDAGLTMLAQASPDVANQLAAGLAGCRADDGGPPPISVYALRLRARLFGHNAPRQRATVRMNEERGETITTKEIGEWPIVERMGFANEERRLIKREEEYRLDLDGGHDRILPRSWLFADMTAVPDFSEQPDGLPGAAVARAMPWRVAPVDKVAALARTDYGMTGDITRVWLRLAADQDGWIAIARDEIIDSLISQPIADRDYQVVRGTTVYADSEQLALVGSPIADPVCDGSANRAPIELDGLYLGLEPGRFVMVTGERADIEHVEGVTGMEAAMIAAVVHDVRADVSIAMPWTIARHMIEGAPSIIASSAAAGPAIGNAAPGMPTGGRDAGGNPDDVDGDRLRAEQPPRKLPGDTVHTFLWLEKPLAYCYRRGSVAIHANMVKASHGETHEETLGNGDGGKANQSFALKNSPLTYRPAPTMAGAADTLRVFVNDIRWNGAASFVDLPATARVYVIGTDHEGKSSVVFGDGMEGARLPTGTLNVAATYRSGLGRAGNVRAGQIQQLVTRPLGVKEVVNPLRASGGADPETRDQTRRNAPLATAALGRVVAPRDYADFARTFAGIAMADAQEISDASRSVIHVTIAGLDDAPLDPGTELLVALRKAYRRLGDPFQAVHVAPRELLLMVVEARLRIDPDRRWEVVAAAAREALLDTFGFERRTLGRGVASSEILNAIQSVEGVAMVDLEVFGAISASTTGSDGTRRPLTPGETETAIKAAVAAGAAAKVDARRARLEDGLLLPAELLLLSPDVAATLVLNQVGGDG